jgi:POT family proton-dependent oligopeptide transporter
MNFKIGRSKPKANLKMPAGIPYIIGNEAAERFGYYGMSSILAIYMSKYLFDASGNPEFTDLQAITWYHIFISACYFFPIIGAFISDVFWGKYRTIYNFSIIYCLGHLILALFNNKIGLFFGLATIAIGSGGIKPCVSAHAGDQFTTQ